MQSSGLLVRKDFTITNLMVVVELRGYSTSLNDSSVLWLSAKGSLHSNVLWAVRLLLSSLHSPSLPSDQPRTLWRRPSQWWKRRELSSLEGKEAAPCAVGISDQYSLHRPRFSWYSLTYWQPGPSFPLEFVWSWRESVDTTWTTLRSASKISSALVFTFIIVLRICNTVLRLNMMFLFLPSSTFKKMKLFTFVCCLLWSILSREFFWLRQMKASGWNWSDRAAIKDQQFGLHERPRDQKWE